MGTAKDKTNGFYHWEKIKIKKKKKPSNIYGIIKIDWKEEKITFSTG